MPAPGKAAASSSSGPGVSVPAGTIGFILNNNAKISSGSAESLLPGGGAAPTRAPAHDAGATSASPAALLERTQQVVYYAKMGKRVFLPETYRQKAAYWRALVPPSITVLCDAICQNKELRLDRKKDGVADARKLGQERFEQVRFVEASLKTWSPESTLQKIRAKTSGGAAASSSAAKNLEPGAKRRKRVMKNSAVKEDDMILIAETAIAEDATVEDGIAHAPDDLCFVPREILVKWFEGQDIVKLQKSNYCTDEDELKKVPEEYRKEWTDLLQKIQCRHKLVNPLAVWSNAVKVVPQRTVEHILSSVRLFEKEISSDVSDDSVVEVDSSPEDPLRKGKKKQLLTKEEQEKEDREKFVKYVHKSCCRECTELLWDAYWNQMARRFAARQVVDEVKTGGTPHELEALLWKNKPKNHKARTEEGLHWNWFPKASWVEHFKKPVDAMKKAGGQGAEGMGRETPFGQLMSTIKGMRGFTGWGCSSRTKDDDGEVSSTRDVEESAPASAPSHNNLGMAEEKFVDTLKTEIQCEAHVKCVHSKDMPKDVTNGGKDPVRIRFSSFKSRAAGRIAQKRIPDPLPLDTFRTRVR